MIYNRFERRNKLEAIIDTKTKPETIGLHCVGGHNIFIEEKRMEMLKCSGKFSICGETKPISEFTKAPIFIDKPFGVDPTCKACRYARAKDKKKVGNNTGDINKLVQDAVNKVLKEKRINNQSQQTNKILTLEERKNSLRPLSIGDAPSGGYRIRYLKTANGKKADIYLASFSNESEEKVIRRAETIKNAFNEILSFNNIDFKI
jgi:hypothetical protein